MADAAGSREHPALGRAATEAANMGEDDDVPGDVLRETYPDPGASEVPVGATGRRRERRSGVTLAVPTAADPDAGLLEAARATPRRSSIIKVSPSFPLGVVVVAAAPLSLEMAAAETVSHVTVAQHCVRAKRHQHRVPVRSP